MKNVERTISHLSRAKVKTLENKGRGAAINIITKWIFRVAIKLIQVALGRRGMQLAVGLILALICGCSSTRWPVLATTYYVATNGNDSNPGTDAAPFRTIARGSRQLAPGDTLFIRQGTYNEAMINRKDGFIFRNGRSITAMTRYAAFPDEEVIINPSSGDFVVYFAPTTAYVEVSGLVIDGTNATSYAVKFGDKGHHMARHNRLLHNEIRHGRMGISNGGWNEIVGNSIHHMRSYGIYTLGDNGLLDGNVFHDIGGYAIHHFQQNKTVNNWVIRNNIIFNNGYGFTDKSGAMRKSAAVVISRGENNQFYNNLVYDNYAGIQVGLGTVSPLIANNTVYGNETYGIEVSSAYSGSLNARVLNNIVWGNKVSQISDTGTNTTLRGNTTTNPNFENAAGGDFHLQAGSPAIDAGETIGEVPVDLAGDARPFGPGYDAGAFEFHAEPAGSKTFMSPSPAH